MNTKFSLIKKHLLLAGIILLTLSGVTTLCPISATAQCVPPSAPTSSSPQFFCASGTTTVADLTATVPLGCTPRWYSASAGGTFIDPLTILVNGNTYYAESYDSSTGCVSNTRSAVLVNFIFPPIVTANPSQTFCNGAVVANLSATLFGPGMINWYANPTGGSALFFAASLSNATTYYAESSYNGCSSNPRIAVTVTLLSRPTPAFISAVTTTCAGTSGNVYTTESGKSNYTWSVSGGGTITSGGGVADNSLTVTWNTAGSQTVSVNYIDGLCNAASPTVLNVNVDSAPLGGSISGSATVCAGINSTLLTLTGNTGSILKWQSSTDNWATPIDIVNTSSTFIATNLNSTTKFRAVLQNGSCFSYSADVTITVDPPSVGGTVAGSTTVCSGTNSTVLTLSGNTGTVTKWQYDEGAGWVDIANVTTSQTATNLIKTTSYRAEVTNGTCPPIYSAMATITVDPPSVGGTVAGSTTVCSGANSTVLTLSGHTGTVTKWQYDDGTGWIDIVNVTTSQTATNLIKTTSYRAQVTNGTCPPVYSSIATITVDPPSVGGTVAGSTSVCTATNSTVLTLSGHTGTVTKWQYDEGAGWTDIANFTTSQTATNLIKTTSYRAEVTNGNCPPIYSSIATITVDPPSVGGTVAGSTSVCTATNSTVLTLNGHTGTVTKWQYDDGAGWTDIANVTTSQTATNLIKTTGYRAEVTNGTCPPIYSSIATITVDPPSVGGTVAGSTTVCSGTNSTVLTLSGHNGTVTKWQYDDGAGWTDIANVTTSQTATNLTKTTNYRAQVTNGACPPIYSAMATITVDQPSVGGTVAGSTTVCSGTNSNVLTLSGNTGTVTKWQYDDGAGWTDIANVTTSQTATNLIKTTSYRAQVTNGTCPPIYSAMATITVDPPSVGGTVAGSTTICSGTNNAILTLSGHTGTVTKWQYDDGAGWTDIANVTTSQTATNLTKTTNYRAQVTNGACPPIYSAMATITVDQPSVGGTVAGSTTVCSGTNSNVLTLSGNTGTVTKWQYDDGAGWTDIANVTTSQTATNLIKTTSYRAEVTNGTCPPVYSSIATITVNGPSVGGTVAGSTSVCSGTNSTLLTLSGHTGTVTKWQYDDGTGWIDIVNVTISQTATNLTKTTSYRAQVTNGACPPIYSSIATITVDPPSVGGTVAGGTTVCSGTNSTVLTLSGNTGTVTKWQYDDGTGWIDIVNVTTSQTATNLTKTTSYRAEVTNGTCPSVYSSMATITVDPPSVGGTVAGTTSVCSGTNNTVLTLSGNTGTVTKWQYDEGAGWTDIANVTTSQTATNLIKTTSYRAEVTNGTCPPVYSSIATITVNGPSVGGTVAGSTSVCSGTNSTLLTLSGHTGTVTKWQYDDGTGWIDIVNVTISQTATNLTKTTSYRAQVTNGACPPIYSSIATITVDPPSVGGTVAGGTTVCSGTNSTVLTLSGNIGTVTKWQYDEGAGWIDIVNATGSQTATNLTKTTSYRAEVTNGTCPPIYSSMATITVNPISVGGSINGSTSVCNCSNSTTLILTGYTGSIIKWQSSTDNWITSKDISNTTNSLTAINLINTTSYHAIVTSGICPSAVSGTAAITVNNCNTAPIITSNGGGATAGINMPENTTSVTTVTATDADIPAQTLTYSISGGADQALFAINSSTGALRFINAPNYEKPLDAGVNNVYNVQVMVSDNCTLSLSDVQDIAITVTDVNDAPIANPDNYEVRENQKLTGNVLSNDSDEDENNLSVNTVPVQPPRHGTLVLSANGNFTYQPLIDYLGNDTFTYQVCDNGVPSLCSVATVSITIVKDDNCEVFVPNSFSPNGDGIHDYFKIRCLYNYENPIIEIYNRWGNLVYKKDHYGNLDFWGTEADAFWNGNSDQKGNLGSKELTVGTYYYILKLNKSDVLTGFIFLNR